nr:hypothetical protein Iba_chr03eCG6730 [Ipomoea batatas]
MSAIGGEGDEVQHPRDEYAFRHCLESRGQESYSGYHFDSSPYVTLGLYLGLSLISVSRIMGLSGSNYVPVSLGYFGCVEVTKGYLCGGEVSAGSGKRPRSDSATFPRAR